jgi:hypothetical protein
MQIVSVLLQQDESLEQKCHILGPVSEGHLLPASSESVASDFLDASLTTRVLLHCGWGGGQEQMKSSSIVTKNRLPTIMKNMAALFLREYNGDVELMISVQQCGKLSCSELRKLYKSELCGFLYTIFFDLHLLDVQIHSRIAHHHIPFSSELMEKRFT